MYEFSYSKSFTSVLRLFSFGLCPTFDTLVDPTSLPEAPPFTEPPGGLTPVVKDCSGPRPSRDTGATPPSPTLSWRPPLSTHGWLALQVRQPKVAGSLLCPVEGTEGPFFVLFLILVPF